MKRHRKRRSESVEDFLKAVYVLQQDDDGEAVSTNRLAAMLGIHPPSVTDMAVRMAEKGMIEHQKYYGVRLTEIGERIARRVLRAHRLIELYLVKELGYKNLSEAHDEADRLEHVVSDRFLEAVHARLGCPTVDLQGDPIHPPGAVVLN